MPTEVAGQVREPLLALAETAQDLFARQCCISGDPNPTNWGIRSDGSPVLFDWERFGYGTPALDLAISLPGLGSLDGEVEWSVAAQYTGLCQALYGTTDGHAERLPLSIRTAKVWSAVEFLDKHVQGLLPEHARANALRVAELLPAVVAAVASGV